MSSASDNNQEQPITLSDNQKKLCDKLEALYKSSSFAEKSPTKMFEGAICALSEESEKNNKDYLAQAAHSLREILYPFYNRKTKDAGITITGEVEKIGSILPNKERIENDIKTLNGELTNIAHHGKPETTSSHLKKMKKKGGMIQYFEDVMNRILQFQTGIHKKIDTITMNKPKTTEMYVYDRETQAPVTMKKSDITKMEKLIGVNEASQGYFFRKAGKEWLKPLRERGYFDFEKLNRITENDGGYSPPEIEYLSRMASEDPEEVTDIIVSQEIKEEYGDSLISQLRLLCNNLPPRYLKKLNLRLL